MATLGQLWFNFVVGDLVQLAYGGDKLSGLAGEVTAVTSLPNSQVLVVDFGSEPFSRPAKNFVPIGYDDLLAASRHDLYESERRYKETYGGPTG